MSYINYRHGCLLRLGPDIFSFTDGVRHYCIIIGSKLHRTTQCSTIAEKVIAKAYNTDVLGITENCEGFIVYCRPILRYSTLVWSRYLVSNRRVLENVRKRFTWIAFRNTHRGPYQPDYITTLRILNLESLEYPVLNSGLILFRLIVFHILDTQLSEIFQSAVPVIDARVSFSPPNEVTVEITFRIVSSYALNGSGFCLPSISLMRIILHLLNYMESFRSTQYCFSRISDIFSHELQLFKRFIPSYFSSLHIFVSFQLKLVE